MQRPFSHSDPAGQLTTAHGLGMQAPTAQSAPAGQCMPAHGSGALQARVQTCPGPQSAAHPSATWHLPPLQ
jgi:hypothetical protein